MTHTVPLWSLWMNAASTALVLAVGLPACGNSGSATETDAGAPTAEGGLSVDAGSLNGLAISNPACGTGSGGVVPQCSECVAGACDDSLAECFGIDWQVSLGGGSCATLGDCVSACECGDNECFRLCLAELEAADSGVCRPCLEQVLACEMANCSSECVEELERDAGSSPGTGHSGQ